MRKRIIRAPAVASVADAGEWLDLEKIAEVEVTSEHPDYPIEGAFGSQNPKGWRASAGGEQTIRLLFDSPQTLRRIHLIFVEDRCERQQEFTLSWSPGQGQPMREIVRQQYHFSPTGATQEVEDYTVRLDAVGILELNIIPDRSGGPAPATLASLHLS